MRGILCLVWVLSMVPDKHMAVMRLRLFDPNLGKPYIYNENSPSENIKYFSRTTQNPLLNSQHFIKASPKSLFKVIPYDDSKVGSQTDEDASEFGKKLEEPNDGTNNRQITSASKDNPIAHTTSSRAIPLDNKSDKYLTEKLWKKGPDNPGGNLRGKLFSSKVYSDPSGYSQGRKHVSNPAIRIEVLNSNSGDNIDKEDISVISNTGTSEENRNSLFREGKGTSSGIRSVPRDVLSDVRTNLRGGVRVGTLLEVIMKVVRKYLKQGTKNNSVENITVQIRQYIIEWLGNTAGSEDKHTSSDHERKAVNNSNVKEVRNNLEGDQVNILLEGILKMVQKYIEEDQYKAFVKNLAFKVRKYMSGIGGEFNTINPSFPQNSEEVETSDLIGSVNQPPDNNEHNKAKQDRIPIKTFFNLNDKNVDRVRNYLNRGNRLDQFILKLLRKYFNEEPDNSLVENITIQVRNYINGIRGKTADSLTTNSDKEDPRKILFVNIMKVGGKYMTQDQIIDFVKNIIIEIGQYLSGIPGADADLSVANNSKQMRQNDSVDDPANKIKAKCTRDYSGGDPENPFVRTIIEVAKKYLRVDPDESLIEKIVIEVRKYLRKIQNITKNVSSANKSKEMIYVDNILVENIMKVVITHLKEGQVNNLIDTITKVIRNYGHKIQDNSIASSLPNNSEEVLKKSKKGNKTENNYAPNQHSVENKRNTDLPKSTNDYKGVSQGKGYSGKAPIQNSSSKHTSKGANTAINNIGPIGARPKNPTIAGNSYKDLIKNMGHQDPDDSKKGLQGVEGTADPIHMQNTDATVNSGTARSNGVLNNYDTKGTPKSRASLGHDSSKYWIKTEPEKQNGSNRDPQGKSVSKIPLRNEVVTNPTDPSTSSPELNIGLKPSPRTEIAGNEPLDSRSDPRGRKTVSHPPKNVDHKTSDSGSQNRKTSKPSNDDASDTDSKMGKTVPKPSTSVKVVNKYPGELHPGAQGRKTTSSSSPSAEVVKEIPVGLKNDSQEMKKGDQNFRKNIRGEPVLKNIAVPVNLTSADDNILLGNIKTIFRKYIGDDQFNSFVDDVKKEVRKYLRGFVDGNNTISSSTHKAEKIGNLNTTEAKQDGPDKEIRSNVNGDESAVNNQSSLSDNTKLEIYYIARVSGNILIKKVVNFLIGELDRILFKYINNTVRIYLNKHYDNKLAAFLTKFIRKFIGEDNVATYIKNNILKVQNPVIENLINAISFALPPLTQDSEKISSSDLAEHNGLPPVEKIHNDEDTGNTSNKILFVPSNQNDFIANPSYILVENIITAIRKDLGGSQGNTLLKNVTTDVWNYLNGNHGRPLLNNIIEEVRKHLVGKQGDYLVEKVKKSVGNYLRGDKGSLLMETIMKEVKNYLEKNPSNAVNSQKIENADDTVGKGNLTRMPTALIDQKKEIDDRRPVQSNSNDIKNAQRHEGNQDDIFPTSVLAQVLTDDGTVASTEAYTADNDESYKSSGRDKIKGAYQDERNNAPAKSQGKTAKNNTFGVGNQLISAGDTGAQAKNGKHVRDTLIALLNLDAECKGCSDTEKIIYNSVRQNKKKFMKLGVECGLMGLLNYFFRTNFTCGPSTFEELGLEKNPLFN